MMILLCIPTNNGFQGFKLVQDFVHPQYVMPFLERKEGGPKQGPRSEAPQQKSPQDTSFGPDLILPVRGFGEMMDDIVHHCETVGIGRHLSELAGESSETRDA